MLQIRSPAIPPVQVLEQVSKAFKMKLWSNRDRQKVGQKRFGKILEVPWQAHR